MNISQKTMLRNLAAVFFISGFCALVYQVSWQRLLFTNFGVDLTSTTVIISIFMAGLGVGAFFGGRLADMYPNKNLQLFCFIELLIGIFGLFSVQIISLINEYTSNMNEASIMLIIFVALLPPTFLMGSTLPLLTAFFNKRIKNIGQSIGILYFTNTLGAAFGALLTGFVLFALFGLQGSIHIACALNVVIATAIYLMYGIKK